MSYFGSMDENKKDVKRTNPYTDADGATSPILNGGSDGGGMKSGGLGESLKRPRGLSIKQSSGAKNMRRRYGVDE